MLDENVSERLAETLRGVGYDVATTAELGRKGATDVSQLSFAARSRRVLVSYNVRHFEMLHEAWRTRSADWNVVGRARHAGILLVPDPGVLSNASTTHVIHQLLSGSAEIENRLFAWDVQLGWQEIVVDQ